MQLKFVENSRLVIARFSVKVTLPSATTSSRSATTGTTATAAHATPSSTFGAVSVSSNRRSTSFAGSLIPSVVAFLTGFTGSILGFAGVQNTFSFEAVIAIFLICKEKMYDSRLRFSASCNGGKSTLKEAMLSDHAEDNLENQEMPGPR